MVSGVIVISIICQFVIGIALLVKFIHMMDDVKALRKHFVGEDVERTDIGAWVAILFFIIFILSIFFAAIAIHESH